MKDILKAILNSGPIAVKTIDLYLSSAYCSETDYIELYNHFAGENDMEKLENAGDIYTEKNDHSALVRYILKIDDNHYNFIYKMIFEAITEKAMEGMN